MLPRLGQRPRQVDRHLNAVAALPHRGDDKAALVLGLPESHVGPQRAVGLGRGTSRLSRHQSALFGATQRREHSQQG